MSGHIPFGVASETQIARQEVRNPPKLAVNKFGPVCKLLWPFKTAAHVASIAGTSQRAAERWLSGEFEPPASVIAAMIVEITKRG